MIEPATGLHVIVLAETIPSVTTPVGYVYAWDAFP
jgi:hypothetical protein